MSAFRKYSIEIKYNGTSEDLIKNVKTITTALGSHNLYQNDILNINNHIITDIDTYLQYKYIYIGDLILINTDINNFKTLYWKEPKAIQEINPFSSQTMNVLYALILLFLIIFIVLYSYCFFNDIYVSTYISDDIHANF